MQGFPLRTPAPARRDQQGLPLSRQASGSLLFPGSTPGAHASPTSCFKSPAPFSTAAASGAASRSAFERSAARTPGEFSPQYVPSGAFAGGASETVRGQLDAPPLQSLHDLAPGSGDVSAATSQPAPSLAPSSLAPSQPASSEGGHWVTIFGYHSVAMVPQVLALLRPSGGQVVQQVPGSGAWLHLRLATWQQQQEVLARHGAVLHGCMIGVIAGVLPSGSMGASAAAAGPFQPAAAAAMPISLSRPRPPGGMHGALDEPPGLLLRMSEYFLGW